MEPTEESRRSDSRLRDKAELAEAPKTCEEHLREKETSVAAQFFKELIIFLSGLFLGFFWYMYFHESWTSDTHIIIGLVVIILCMARYLMLLKHHFRK